MLHRANLALWKLTDRLEETYTSGSATTGQSPVPTNPCDTSQLRCINIHPTFQAFGISLPARRSRELPVSYAIAKYDNIETWRLRTDGDFTKAQDLSRRHRSYSRRRRHHAKGEGNTSKATLFRGRQAHPEAKRNTMLESRNHPSDTRHVSFHPDSLHDTSPSDTIHAKYTTNAAQTGEASAEPLRSPRNRRPLHPQNIVRHHLQQSANLLPQTSLLAALETGTLRSSSGTSKSTIRSSPVRERIPATG